ncbi:TnpV protein [Lachnospiraceae bacterium MD329]|nr:TnpV protein [Lachnospiraceae bacterium MD329]
MLAYLEKIDTKANNEVDRPIAELAIKQGVTEQLKANDQMEWVGMMNNIKAQAEEIVYSTIVYKREAL